MDNGGAFTDRLFAQAAIAPGAHALDIGCGPGDVTFRLSRAVGPQGRVIGLDLNAAALERARSRAVDSSFTNTAFVEQDLFDFAKDCPKFDVVTCRRVLMYLPDQAKAAETFFNLLKPSGILIVQEHDTTMRHPAGDRPLADQAQRWIWDTVRSEGANLGTGFDLHSLLAKTGFSNIRVIAEAVVETPDQAAETVEIVRVMLPRIEAAGIATANEIDIETLGDRMLSERSKSETTSITEMVFGAIARVS
ncbi:MAG: class I SAM-dependent methyltransferase [Pseudomonadota bacterium]